MDGRKVKIPFDSFVLEAVVADMQAFAGGKVQEIRQPSEFEVGISVYARGSEAMLLLSCHPLFFRAHLATRRPPTITPPPQFLTALRSRIEGTRLESVTQMNGERMLFLEFVGEEKHTLVAELMGKHSNLILFDGGNRVVAVAKWVGRSKSSRPILPGVRYELPPVVSADGQAKGSKFQRDLVAAGGKLQPIQPVLVPGSGAYPVSVAALGLQEFPRQSISIALEHYYNEAIPAHEAESLRSSLLAQLDRVILARNAAISDLRQAEAAGLNAGQWQRWGELVLAYGPSQPPGQASLAAWDYDGSEVTIKLDPELDFKENANRYFNKAKKAKGRMGLVQDQIERLSSDLISIESLRDEVSRTERLDRMEALREEAKKRHWLTEQRLPTTVKEERPYQGHRIRELVGPGGYQVLFGENAESNDYLTLRVAKPNDWWLHVRGGVSAHVVIQTRNQPEKVQRETLMWAAKIAVQNSPSKHAGYVPVDFTLKKYVRKPKGAPKGTALYTHEKTLHVES